jgi:hypothetical protein
MALEAVAGDIARPYLETQALGVLEVIHRIRFDVRERITKQQGQGFRVWARGLGFGPGDSYVSNARHVTACRLTRHTKMNDVVDAARSV